MLSQDFPGWGLGGWVRKVENKATLSPASAGAWLSLATGKKRNKKI